MDGWQSQRLTVLLVEQNAGQAAIVCRSLSPTGSRGAHVERVGNIAAARERLQRGGLHAVLVDLVTAEMAGSEGLAGVIESSSGLPVIVLASLPDIELAKSVLRLGAEDYLVKCECSGDTLLWAIGKAIERKNRQGKLADQLAALRRHNDELNNFAHIVAHEIKSPLIGVSACMDRLEEEYADQLDEDTRNFLADSRNAIDNIAEVVRDLLELVRLGSHRKKFTEVNLEAVFYQACAGVRTMVKESGAIITHDPLPTIDADETQMRVLLQNLLGNAIKYRGQASPKVHVGVNESTKEWVLNVRDNGRGIDPADHERIFGIFERLGTSPRTPGSGIGLTLCRLIARNHGGTIWVDSHLGDGANFFVSIPKRARASGNEVVEGNPVD